MTNNVNHELHPITDEEKEAAMLPAQEKKWPFNNKKLMTAMFGIAVATVCLSGCNSSADNNPNKVTATSNDSGEKQPAVPSEAQSFVTEYGNRYSDSVSTYYAVEAYKDTHSGVDPVMSNEYVKNYDFNGEKHFPISPLGFELKELPTDVSFNQESSIKLFNEYTALMLGKYMELISKNPMPDEIKIIDQQFLDNCAGQHLGGYDSWDTEQRDSANNLLRTLKSVVAKHGSAANYSVALASNDKTNTNATLFNKNIPTVTGYYMYNNEKLIAANDDINLVINVDTYKNENVSHSKEVLKDFQLKVVRQPSSQTGNGSAATWTYISIGQYNTTTIK
jgi:hypothetical protein